MSEPTLIERLRYQSKVIDSREIERQGPEYLCELTGRAAERIEDMKYRITELEAAAQAVIDMYYATGNQIDPLIDILYDVLERGDG